MEEWRDVVVDREEADTYKGKYQVSNLGRVKSLHRGKEKVLTPTPDKRGYLRIALSKNGKQKIYSVHRLVGLAFLSDTHFYNAEIDHINTIITDNRVENLRWVTRKENNNNELTRKHNSEARKGKYHLDETKQKLSEINKGENHPFYGKHHSDESRQKMSESRKGENNHLYGKHHTDESKQKMSEARKGKCVGDKNPRARAVICITTGEIFATIKEGAEFYGIKNNSDISACCKGKLKSCGKHPTTNEPLIWKYLDE